MSAGSGGSCASVTVSFIVPAGDGADRKLAASRRASVTPTEKVSVPFEQADLGAGAGRRRPAP